MCKRIVIVRSAVRRRAAKSIDGNNDFMSLVKVSYRRTQLLTPSITSIRVLTFSNFSNFFMSKSSPDAHTAVNTVIAFSILQLSVNGKFIFSSLPATFTLSIVLFIFVTLSTRNTSAFVHKSDHEN